MLLEKITISNWRCFYGEQQIEFEISNLRKTLDQIFKYYNWFIWKEDHGPITVGLFFSNKQDAESYLHEICLKDPRGAQNLGLSVKTTALDTFYYLNRTSNPRVQVRMISDLQELDELLRIHINKHFSLIHPKNFPIN